MNNTKIEELIIKFISKSITETELDDLSIWLEEPGNEEKFKQYIQLNYALEYNLLNFELEKKKVLLHSKVTTMTSDRGRVKHFTYIKYVAAAAIALLIAIPIFLTSDSVDEADTTIVVTDIEPGTDKAVLTMEDGNRVTLEEGKEYSLVDRETDGKQLVYKPKKATPNSELKYNYLTIPRGGQFFVTLSDGTRVWLNSESQLKYPMSFASKKERVVELLYGEAYFDVTPSIANEGTPFKVLSKGQEVQVLGTEFNVKSYDDEAFVYTTLVEGSVSIGAAQDSPTLSPGQQSIFNIANMEVSVRKDIDITPEISWRKGVFMFKGKKLREIVKVLSRWYDIDIVIGNKELENVTFRGVLGRDQDLNQILSSLKNLSVIKDYEFKDGNIMIR
nr:FecR family protein [Allomuricauda sp.]